MENNPYRDNHDESCMILGGAQILTPAGWLNKHALVIEGSKIKAIISMDDIANFSPAHVYEFSPDFFIVPGFIDIHMHGLCGADVMDERVDALQTISKALAMEGVTSFLATTMSTESSHLVRVLQSIADFQSKEEGAELLGVHLEGPFISQCKQGAQRKIDITPDIHLFTTWQKAAKGKIKLVTLAPEISEIQQLIEYLKKEDVKVSIGHSDATFEETHAAIKLGACHATHLFNAMRVIHHRAPGVGTALLLDDNISAELIVDDHHLHPAMVSMAYRLKPKNKLILITDSMRGKCLAAGEYELGGQVVTILESGKAILKDGTLAGSVLSLPKAIKNTIRITDCSFAEAIVMASQNPAEMLGLVKKGKLEVGYDADIAILNQDFEVTMTVGKGKTIFAKTDIETLVDSALS